MSVLPPGHMVIDGDGAQSAKVVSWPSMQDVMKAGGVQEVLQG